MMDGLGKAFADAIITFCIICFVGGVGIGLGGYFLIMWLIKHISISVM